MTRESTIGPIYAGTFERSVDVKNRVTIPAEWKVEEGGALFVVPQSKRKFLIGMSPEEFNSVEEQIGQTSLSRAEQRKMIRHFYSSARMVTTDKQGRILLPDEHCKAVGLGNAAVLLGGGKRFEIWSADAWAKVETEDAALIEQAGEELDM